MLPAAALTVINSILTQVGSGVVVQTRSMREVERMVQCVKRGDASSLAELRKKLGKTQTEIAALLGIPESRLVSWETGKEQPSSTYHIRWKLQLSTCIDQEISSLLGTENKELVTQFWELMWRLNE